MRIVTLDTVSDGRRMDGAFQGRRVFIGVAGDAEGLRSGGDELDARDILVNPHFVAAHAAHGDGGVDKLPFGLILMAFQTLGGIDFRIEWDGVNGGISP